MDVAVKIDPVLISSLFMAFLPTILIILKYKETVGIGLRDTISLGCIGISTILCSHMTLDVAFER